MGWVSSPIEGTTKTAPTFVTSANMGTSDVTYYAVYATQTGSGSSEPTLVNSTSGLIAGNTYYIAASATYASTATAMGASTGGNNFPATSFQYAVPLTLGGNATDGWTFSYTDGGTTYYLDPTSTTGSNYLKRNGSVTDYGKFSISFSSNAAVITSLGKSSRNILRYNSSSSTCFSCYSSGQGDVYLFAEGGGTTYSDYCTTVGDEPTPTKTLTSIEVSGTPAEFWKGDAFNHNGMTVTAHYDDESTENVTASAEFSTPDMSTAGEKTVTITYQDQTDTYTINVKTIANTQATAYTVAKAKELIDAGKDLGTEVYVAGKVSQVDSYSSTYKSITYWISTDGTTSGQFEIYGGKGLENADFSSMDDVQVGAEVIVYGKLKKFNSTYELDSNNYLVSYSYTPPTTDFINTPAATVKVLDPISIKDYINGEYSSYEISTSIDGKTQKDYEFVCIYDQIRFCKGGTYVVDVTGTSGSDTQSGQVTFTVTPSGAELTSVTLGGTLTKTTYTVGETFDFSGLTLTANCSDGTSADITSEATWEADPTTLNEIGTVTVTVMGSYCGESAIDEYDVTVVAAPQQVTWDLTIDETATATVDEISWTSTAVSMIDTRANDKSTAANNYYPGTPDKNYTSTRFYSGSTLTITPANGITITSVEYNVANSNANYANAIAGEWTNASASKSADNSKVTITPTDGTKAISIVLTATTGATGVTVYYTGTPVVLTLDHITISGYTTTFTEGDTFNFGGTVTAHYNDESTKDVTSSATFTGYDMSILGTEQTVTVSYTEGGVTKEASYNIIVNAATKYTVTIIEPENGTLVVKHGEETIASGTSVVSGTVLTIEATPADGYDYQNWQYKVEGGSWVTKYTNYDYTVDSNVSFRANFEPIVTGTFTINYSVNGIIRKTETLDANASLNFPAVSSMYGKVFLGWTTSEVPDEVDVQPETIGAIKATTDATYYALFATKNTTAGSDELTKVDELVAGMDVILAMEEAGTPSKGISGVDNEHSTAIVSTDPSEWVKFTVNVIGENTCLAYGTQYVTPSDKKENKFKLTDDNGTNFYIDNHQLGYTTDDDYILAENHSTSAGKDEYFYRFYKTSTVSGNTNPNQVYTPFFVYTDGSSTTYSAYTTLPSYVKLDESTTNGTYENETFGTVKIIRSMKADDTWNSLCLPFSMNEEQITTAFGEDTDVRELTTASVTGTAPDEVLHLNFTQVTAIEAGKLYMVRVPAAITEFYVEDTEVNTAEPVQDYSKGDYTIQAHSNYNYMDGTTNGYVPVGSFVISSNKFMQVGSSTQKMKAFRGYITAIDASGNPVKALGIGFIDPLTGINNVEFNTDARIYNLQGLQQSKVQKGINIVNGKKIIR